MRGGQDSRAEPAQVRAEDLLLGPTGGPGRLAAPLARVLLESLGEGFVYIEGGAIRNVNRAFTEMIGMSPADVIGQSAPFSFWLPEDTGANMALLRQVVSAGGGCFELTLQRKDGSRFLAELNANIVTDETGGTRGFLTLVRDVTEQRRQQRELADSEQQLRLMFEHSAVGIAVVDLDGRWLQVNPSLCDMLGYPQEELVRLPADQFRHPDDQDVQTELVAELISGTRSSYQVEQRYVRKDGEILFGSLRVVLVRTPDGLPAHFIAQILDVSHRVRTEEELTALATTDPLTQLPNRRVWDQRLDELSPMVARGELVILGILDIDHFKIYNDTHGHPAGDDVLVQTAATWSRLLADSPGTATLVRLGGEEFGVVWHGLQLEQARRIAQELTDTVAHDQQASCGLTCATAGESRRTVMARADAALYAAKRAGRHRVEVLMPG